MHVSPEHFLLLTFLVLLFLNGSIALCQKSSRCVWLDILFSCFCSKLKHRDHLNGERDLLALLFSSPEPSGSQDELIVYHYSGVHCRRCRRRRRQQCLNIFSSETALPIKAKFYVEPPWEGGTKIYINGPGHMTKMAAMPIYGKNL